MKYVDEFRNPVIAKQLLVEINTLADQIMQERTTPIQIMEVCGGHTHSIFHHGLEQLLSRSIEFVHGPGCPVCVLPKGVIDNCIDMAQQAGVIFTTFGDAIRVPGSEKSLLQVKAQGADIRIVYSPMDALKIAKENPESHVVFFALGFETTMPSTALTVLQAEKEQVSNFSLFCNHITIIPTLQMIVDEPDLRLDGFLGPGHVSLIIGSEPYTFIAQQYQKPLVVSGFELLDILQSIKMLLVQIHEGRAEVENQYNRLVQTCGNQRALAAMAEVFETRESCEWRGLGEIAESGVRMRSRFANFDAEQRFEISQNRLKLLEVGACSDVLIGKMKPTQCESYGKGCTPERPLGALMVSTEGACHAYYAHGRIAAQNVFDEE